MADTSNSTSASSVRGTPAKSMADLMASYRNTFQTFKKGETVKGRITKLTKNEILVDVRAKSAAVVLEKDKTLLQTLLDTLHVGDEVEVSVLNPESEMGNPVVSLRRFLSDSAWKLLEDAQKSEKQMEVRVTDMTKGGVIVVTENGLSGFLPNSHISAPEQLAVGKQIKVRPVEINRKDNKIIFSKKQNISEQTFTDATKQFKQGDTIEVTVMNIAPFGIFVSIPVVGKTTDGDNMVLDGLIHISEISWEKVDDITQLYTVGQTVEAKIIGFDKNARRVDLSIKQFTEDPFEKILQQYPIDARVTAQITSIDDNGAHLALEGNVEGLIRKDKIPPTVTYTEGQTVTATVSEIDKKRHKIYFLPVLLEKPLMYR